MKLKMQEYDELKKRLMNNKDNFYILDCTLRDGGYYNNWNFSPRLIQDYLNLISKTDIKYVELGFRGLLKIKTLV